jgi:hypothetical protein
VQHGERHRRHRRDADQCDELIMALIAVAADKGAPGVTTTSLALAAVWARPALLAECDPSGGDLVYRFPSADGGRLDPRRGMLSLAVSARRGLQHSQLWEHAQKAHGGLDLLTGVTNAEQGTGMNLLWGPLGRAFNGNPQVDIIADCGRLGPDGPIYDLLAEAAIVVLVTRPHLGDVIRLRDRVGAISAAMDKRGRRGFGVEVVVVAEQRRFRNAIAEVNHILTQNPVPARVVGGLADDPKCEELLRGDWGGKLDKTALIRTAREVATQLGAKLPPLAGADGAGNGQPPGRPVNVAGAPVAGAPVAGAHGTGAPVGGAHGTGAHGTGAHSTGPLGTGAPGTGAPGTGPLGMGPQGGAQPETFPGGYDWPRAQGPVTGPRPPSATQPPRQPPGQQQSGGRHAGAPNGQKG